jgi:hypothetical protein
MSEPCGVCSQPIPASSHSPWFCSPEHETAWKSATYGEQAPTPTTAFPDTQLSADGHGPVRWLPLSWWTDPSWVRKHYDDREAS